MEDGMNNGRGGGDEWCTLDAVGMGSVDAVHGMHVCEVQPTTRRTRSSKRHVFPKCGQEFFFISAPIEVRNVKL